jgi:hypothetical protein
MVELNRIRSWLVFFFLLSVTNTLAYYGVRTLRTRNVFIVQAVKLPNLKNAPKIISLPIRTSTGSLDRW